MIHTQMPGSFHVYTYARLYLSIEHVNAVLSRSECREEVHQHLIIILQCHRFAQEKYAACVRLHIRIERVQSTLITLGIQIPLRCVYGYVCRLVHCKKEQIVKNHTDTYTYTD